VGAGQQLAIEDCFLKWRETLTCTPNTLVTDYWPRVQCFTRWCETHDLMYWRQLRVCHLQEYAGELVKRGCGREHLGKCCRVIRRASHWAAVTWPECFVDFAEGFRLPTVKEANRQRRRDPLTLEEVAEFLLFLREQPFGWNILTGVALAGIAGLRLQEARCLKWIHIDLRTGMVSIVAENSKTAYSERTIPIPELVLDILREAYRRQQPDENDYVVPTNSRHSFRRAFYRHRNHWRPGLNVEPSGLRRVLRSEWFKRHWHTDSLSVYRGHKPPSTSPVDWKHYIIFDPQGLQQTFREEVVAKIDEVVKPFRDQWNDHETGDISAQRGS